MVILIIFVISTILLIYITRSLMKYPLMIREMISLNHLKTGDMIFTASRLGRYTPNLVGIEHTHCALVVVTRDGVPRILELTSANDVPAGNGHPLVQDLRGRLQDFDGYISIRPIAEALDPGQILAVASDLKNVNFNSNYTMDFLKYAWAGKKRHVATYCCSEFVYSVLVGMKVLPYTSNNFHDSFRYLSEVEQMCDNSYGPMKRLVF